MVITIDKSTLKQMTFASGGTSPTDSQNTAVQSYEREVATFSKAGYICAPEITGKTQTFAKSYGTDFTNNADNFHLF